MILRPKSREATSMLLLIAVLWSSSSSTRHSVLAEETPSESKSNNTDEHQSTDQNTPNLSSSSSSSSSLSYSCPNTPSAKAENDFDGYWATYKHMNAENQQQLHNFRTLPYDQRSDPYWKMKEKAYAFKAAYFGNILKSGDHLYESACGTGGNILMTAEILKEEYAIHNLTLHGNDYLPESVDMANALLYQEQQQESWYQFQPFCQGDSTNLQHIPDNSLDVAYTGFIDPILDPLNILGGTASLVQTENFHEHLCESASKGNHLHEHLTELMQQKQEDWHAAWVTELIRITKPGKYIIIEDVGWPGCSELADWAGVDTYWWYSAIDTYQWDVDPASLAIAEKPWYRDRYNVRLRKNDPAQPNLTEDTLKTNQASWEFWRKYKLHNWWDEPEDEWPKDYRVAPTKRETTEKTTQTTQSSKSKSTNPWAKDAPKTMQSTNDKDVPKTRAFSQTTRKEPEEMIAVPFPGSVKSN